MRTFYALPVVFLSSMAHAATITHDGIGTATTVSLTDPGAGWVHVIVGGNFDVTPPDRLVVQNQVSEDKVWLEQLANPIDRDHFWMTASALTRFTTASETNHYTELHLGTLNGPPVPNSFQSATTWELIGGDVVNFGNVAYQEWTYIVDGGTPYQVDVRTAPEPTTVAVASMGLLGLIAARRRR